MTSADFTALSPLVALVLTAAVLMLQIAVRRRHALTLGLSLAGMTAGLTGLFMALGSSLGPVTELLVMDTNALYFIGLIILATAGSALLAYGYLKRSHGQREEFYLLIVMAALGAGVMAASRHFASFFLGLEILTVALYALIAYPRWRTSSLEAGLKYLILAGTASAFLLFGMALVYMDTGALDFARFTARIAAAAGGRNDAILFAGTAMLMVGIGFKLALVPFHMWTPDVYQGAPAPTTGFVATVSKVALAAVLIRLFSAVDLSLHPSLYRLFGLVAALSMVGGNLLALSQRSVKRILAYSSIAHMGYLLVAIMAGGRTGAQAVAFYLAAYVVTLLGAFGVIAVLSSGDRDADDLSDFRGLTLTRPWLGAVFTAMLLSLAGIPLTAGFVAKFYLLATGLGQALGWLVLVLLLTSGISLYYYLRIVVVLFSPPEEDRSRNRPQPVVSFSGGVVLAAATLVLIWLGIAPQPLLLLLIGIAG